LFYTRPHLEPLGLDLATIDGGGSFPVQFYGRTVDDRPVYIRYRNGWFSVECGEVGASEGETRVLLEANIGPHLHGEMLLEQACDLAGITVRGKRLVLSDEALRIAREKESILDWSGRTTYWVRDLLVTPEGGQALFERLAARHPDIRIVETWWERASNESRKMKRKRSLRDGVLECRGHVTFGIGVDRTRLDEVLGNDHSPVGLDDAFAHTVHFTFHWADPIWSNTTRPRFFETLAPEIFINGSELGGRLITQFATADPQGRAFVESVVAVADACFDNRIETVDLATRQVVGTMTHHCWYSVDLRERCREQSGRFIGWWVEGTGEALRYLGFRPAMTAG
jgi:hypothetical protein